MPTYHPGVYRSCGGDNLTFSSAATLTLTGQAVTTTGALTANTLTCTGKITGSSDISIAGGATFSSGVTAASFTCTGAIAGSTNLTIGGRGTFTSGVNASTGAFSSGVSIAANLAVTSGITATTGNFSSGIQVSGRVYGLGGFQEAAPVAETTANSTMLAYGVSLMPGCSSGQVMKALATPTAGYHKYIVCIEGGSVGATGYTIVECTGGGSANVTIGATGSQNILFTTGGANYQFVHLIGISATGWLVLAQSTDVTFSDS